MAKLVGSPVSRGSRNRQIKRRSEMGTYLHSKAAVSE
jgi:hypothetical protein